MSAPTLPTRFPAGVKRAGWPVGDDGPVERAFLPAALEIVETPASTTARFTALAICAVFAAALCWAWLGRIDIIAVAPGKIIATGRTKIIQPSEIATIHAIRVEEGQRVHAGDVLIELDETVNVAERDRATNELRIARLDMARLRVLLGENGTLGDVPDASPQDIAGARTQLDSQMAQRKAKLAALDSAIEEAQAEAKSVRVTIEKMKTQMPFVQGHVDIRRQGLKTGFGSRLDYLDAERQLSELKSGEEVEGHHLSQTLAAIDAAQKKRAEAEAEFRSGWLDELTRAQQRANAAAAALTTATEKTGLDRMTAPVDGTVQDMAVHTLGEVVTPAQRLLNIVPDGALEVEAVIDNHDIGFVEAGQTAAVKVETFPFTRYGLLHGTVRLVAADAIQDRATPDPPGEARSVQAQQPQARFGYIARVTLDRTQMRIEGRTLDLVPGMAVSVEIKTGNRRFLDYLLSPIARSADEGMRER